MTEPRPGRLFYGWFIVAVAFAANFMATGVGFYVFNAFMKPLCELRGWTRADINLGPVIGGAVSLICTLAYGTLVMRTGPRALMALGAIVSGLAFALLGQARTIGQFYLGFILLFAGNGALAGIVANTAVNDWFVKKRGRALGLANIGISLSGAVLPFAAMLLIERTDLARAFLWIGAAIALVAPAAWLVVRDRPEDHGLHPDGAVGEEAERLAKIAAAESRAGFWTLSDVVRSATFWKLGVVYALAMAGVVGVMFQLAPRFEDVGFDSRAAMLMMSVTALLGALGKYFWGSLCDRFEPRRVVAALIATTAAGLGLGLVQGSLAALVLFIAVFGFAMGGVVSTTPVLIGHFFGRAAYASVARVLGRVVRLQVVGYYLMGRSFKITGSYDAAYAIFIALDLIAAALVLSIRQPQG